MRATYTKGNQYREPPIPETVEAIADTLVFTQADDEPLIDVWGRTIVATTVTAMSELVAQVRLHQG